MKEGVVFASLVFFVLFGYAAIVTGPELLVTLAEQEYRDAPPEDSGNAIQGLRAILTGDGAHLIAKIVGSIMGIAVCIGVYRALKGNAS